MIRVRVLVAGAALGAFALGFRMLRPERLRTAAVVGSESTALAAQIDDLPEGYRADVAVIVIGGNDVTHMVPPWSAAGAAAAAYPVIAHVPSARARAD